MSGQSRNVKAEFPAANVYSQLRSSYKPRRYRYCRAIDTDEDFNDAEVVVAAKSQDLCRSGTHTEQDRTTVVATDNTRSERFSSTSVPSIALSLVSFVVVSTEMASGPLA